MIEQPSFRFRSSSISFSTALLVLLLYAGLGPAYGQQSSQTGGTQANSMPRLFFSRFPSEYRQTAF